MEAQKCTGIGRIKMSGKSINEIFPIRCLLYERISSALCCAFATTSFLHNSSGIVESAGWNIFVHFSKLSESYTCVPICLFWKVFFLHKKVRKSFKGHVSAVHNLLKLSNEKSVRRTGDISEMRHICGKCDVSIWFMSSAWHLISKCVANISFLWKLLIRSCYYKRKAEVRVANLLFHLCWRQISDYSEHLYYTIY